MHRTSTEQLIISIYPSTFPSSSFPGPYLTSSEPTKAPLLSKPKQCSIQSISRILPYQSPPPLVHRLFGVSPITPKYKSYLPPPTPREQYPLAAADQRWNSVVYSPYLPQSLRFLTLFQSLLYLFIILIKSLKFLSRRKNVLDVFFNLFPN